MVQSPDDVTATVLTGATDATAIVCRIVAEAGVFEGDDRVNKLIGYINYYEATQNKELV